MENEKKSTPAPEQKTGNSGNHRSKHRSNKHKSYFMTPGGEQSAAPEQKPQQNNQQPAQKKAEGGNSAPTPKTHNRHNNHHKHKKNQNPQTKDEQKNVNTPVDAQPKSTEPPKASSENASQKSAQTNNNHSKNKRKHHNDRRRDEKHTGTENANNIAKSTDTLSESTFVPMPKSQDRLQKSAPQKLSKFSDSPEFEKYSDYEEYSFEELYGKLDDASAKSGSKKSEGSTDDTVAEPNEPMVEVVGIRFKASGKTYYFAPNGISLKAGAKAIVETARGLEYGDVALGNTMVKESETVSPLRPVIRKATDADVKHHEENKEKEDAAFRICNEKISAHGLDMKLIDAQYTFDNTKLLFYFTSAGRVDFRDLVKDLASVFRTRIELRQIGIRDEAKMVGGLGLCGRPLCCSLFLTDFGQVSIKMAKEQNLSLNSSKISGICGRLMCCLRYEHETYEYEIKRTPPVDSLVRTVDGVGVVTEINPLAATIKVKLVSSPDTPPKAYKRDEVSVLKKKQENQ